MKVMVTPPMEEAKLSELSSEMDGGEEESGDEGEQVGDVEARALRRPLSEVFIA